MRDWEDVLWPEIAARQRSYERGAALHRLRRGQRLTEKQVGAIVGLSAGRVNQLLHKAYKGSPVERYLSVAPDPDLLAWVKGKLRDDRRRKRDAVLMADLRAWAADPKAWAASRPAPAPSSGKPLGRGRVGMGRREAEQVGILLARALKRRVRVWYDADG